MLIGSDHFVIRVRNTKVIVVVSLELLANVILQLEGQVAVLVLLGTYYDGLTTSIKYVLTEFGNIC